MIDKSILMLQYAYIVILFKKLKIGKLSRAISEPWFKWG